MQYVSRGSDKSIPEKIEKLNSLMLSENKASKDMRLAYWMFAVGNGYRLVLRAMSNDPFDEAPFEIYTLDPRNTFVTKNSGITKRPVMATTYTFKSKFQNEAIYTVYTNNKTYRISGTGYRAARIDKVITHNNGFIPIIEYPCNPLRMGSFEIVLDLLDAINLTESNRLDGIEQFIQALMVFEGVDISRKEILELKDLGAIRIPPAMDGRTTPRLYYLNEQLDQSQTQTLADALYQEILQIVGMPSQGNANMSDSSNNGAVMMKNGWWNAEARAKETIGMWKEAETEFLKIILRICRESNALDLRISDIEMKFGRNSYEDKITKTQCFTSLIAAGAPPIQAFTYSNLAPDPESAAITYDAYQKSKEDELNEFPFKVAESEKEQQQQDEEAEARKGEQERKDKQARKSEQAR